MTCVFGRQLAPILFGGLNHSRRDRDWRPVEMTAGLQLPALSVPFGLSQGSGLPVGAQVVGPAGSDGKILALGRAIEAANKS